MLSYVRKYIVSMAYLSVFSLLAVVGYGQKNILSASVFYGIEHDNKKHAIFRGIVFSSVSVLALSFYSILYSICRWTIARSRFLIQRYKHPHDEYEAPENASFNLENKIDEGEAISSSFILTPAGSINMLSGDMWNYMYTFGFSVFCASYSIDVSNVISSFFFCVGTVAVSVYLHLKHTFSMDSSFLSTHKKKIKGLVTLLVILMCLINILTLITWAAIVIYPPKALQVNTSAFMGHNETRVGAFPSFQWRDVWFETLGPLLAPYCIAAFKNKFPIFHQNQGKSHSVLRRGGGDVYLFFAMPVTALVSMLFLSMYFSMIDSGGVTLVDEGLSSKMCYLSVQFVAAPLALIIALVIYIGAVGQSEYSMIASSSLYLVFNVYSSLNLPLEPRYGHMITACCIMSLIMFMISLLILMIKVHCNETEGDALLEAAHLEDPES